MNFVSFHALQLFGSVNVMNKNENDIIVLVLLFFFAFKRLELSKSIMISYELYSC